MSLFPLLRLPELAQINMLRQVELVDLVTLSFCSHKAKKLVSLAKVKLDELTFNLFDSQFHIVVNNTFWVHYSSPIPIVLLTPLWSQKPAALFKPSDRREPVAPLVIGHLMDTFREVDNIRIHSDLDNLLTFPIWNYGTTIKNLAISTKFVKTAIEEVMNFILDRLTVTGHLEIRHTVALGFQYSNGFQQERVTIYHANWVHFNAVLHSKSSYILLFEVPWLPATQLQTFLKLWMDKTHIENLKELEIVTESESFSDSYFQQVINGIEHERLDSRTIKVRRIDGKVATVDMNMGCFNFKAL